MVVEVKSFEEENLKKDGIYREKMLKKIYKTATVNVVDLGSLSTMLNFPRCFELRMEFASIDSVQADSGVVDVYTTPVSPGQGAREARR